MPAMILFQESFIREPDNHDIIGNLCVMCQLNWPRNKPLFTDIINKVKLMEKFTYPAFFDYIISKCVVMMW